MNLEKAVTLLGIELAKREVINVVYDSAIKQELLKHPYSITRNKKGEILQGTFNSVEYRVSSNYIFWDKEPAGLNIITPVEEKILRKIFYKNVPLRIQEAFKEIGIESFEGIYKLYSGSSEEKEELIKKISAIERAEVGDTLKYPSDFYGKEVYLVPSIIEPSKRMNNGLFMIGKRYEDKTLKRELSYLDGGHLNPEEIKIVKKRFPYEEFIEFIFNLPKEEQNLELNKELIKNTSEIIDFSDILMNKYWNRDNFIEHYDLTNNLNKKRIIEMINSIPINYQMQDLNMKLFGQGEKVYVDFLEAYEKSPNNFIKLFEGAKKQEKKDMLKILFELPTEKLNPNLSKWLSENYSEIVEEIGIKISSEI